MDSVAAGKKEVVYGYREDSYESLTGYPLIFPVQGLRVAGEYINQYAMTCRDFFYPLSLKGTFSYLICFCQVCV